MATPMLDREYEERKKNAKKLIAAGGCAAIKFWSNTDALRLCPTEHKDEVKFEPPEGMVYISEWLDAAKKAIELIRKGIELIEPKQSPSPSLPETEQEPHIRVQLKDGSIANVSPNASPELLKAMETMVELAKKMPDPDQPVPEEVMEWIGNESVKTFGLHTPKNAYFHDGAIAMYKRDQATISSLQSRLSSTEAERDAIRQAFDLQAEELRKYRNQ